MKQLSQTALAVIIGDFIYALGVAFFIEPAGLIMGGSTGISLFLHHTFGLSTSNVVLVINTVLFLVGLAVLGKMFAVNTLLSTFIFPFELKLTEYLASQITLTDDIFLCTFFGGALIGISLGIVIKSGASTGGMDIPPLVLNKFFGTSISGAMWVFDVIILLIQALFSTREMVLYGIILVVLYTVVLDKTLVLGQSKTQIKVISRKSDEIRQAILSDIDRGVTILHAQTGYLHEETEIVLSIISKRELVKTERFIHEIDPDAFIIVARVTEVKGRGFSKSKKYL